MLAGLVQTLCYGLYKYRSRLHFPPEAVIFLKITVFWNVILAIWYKSARVSEKPTGSHLQGRRCWQQIPQKYQVSTMLEKNHIPEDRNLQSHQEVSFLSNFNRSSSA